MIGEARRALVSVDAEDGAVFAGIRGRRPGQSTRSLKVDCPRLEPNEARLLAKWLCQAANIAEGHEKNAGFTIYIPPEKEEQKAVL